MRLARLLSSSLPLRLLTATHISAHARCRHRRLSPFSDDLPGFTRWFGNIACVSTVEMFKLNLRHDLDQTLEVHGRPVKLPLTVHLNAGWNWLPFPYQEAADLGAYQIESALTSGDVFKRNNAHFTVWYDVPGFKGWLGSPAATKLRPGEGHMLRLASGSQFTFPRLGGAGRRALEEAGRRTLEEAGRTSGTADAALYPTRRRALQTTARGSASSCGGGRVAGSDPSTWATAGLGSYPDANAMTVGVKLGGSLAGGGWLAALCDGEIRGVSTELTTVPAVPFAAEWGGAKVFSLAVQGSVAAGDTGKTITFEYSADGISSLKLDTLSTWASDAVIGGAFSPFVVEGRAPCTEADLAAALWREALGVYLGCSVSDGCELGLELEEGRSMGIHATVSLLTPADEHGDTRLQTMRSRIAQLRDAVASAANVTAANATSSGAFDLAPFAGVGAGAASSALVVGGVEAVTEQVMEQIPPVTEMEATITVVEPSDLESTPLPAEAPPPSSPAALLHPQPTPPPLAPLQPLGNTTGNTTGTGSGAGTGTGTGTGGGAGGNGSAPPPANATLKVSPLLAQILAAVHDFSASPDALTSALGVPVLSMTADDAVETTATLAVTPPTTPPPPPSPPLPPSPLPPPPLGAGGALSDSSAALRKDAAGAAVPTIVVILGASVGGLCLLALVAVRWCRRMRREHSKAHVRSTVRGLSKAMAAHASASPEAQPYANAVAVADPSHTIKWPRLELEQLLGVGRLGKCFVANLDGEKGTKMVLRRLDPQIAHLFNGFTGLQAYANLTKVVPAHPHLVEMVGLVSDGLMSHGLLSLQMPHTLSAMLAKARNSPVVASKIRKGWLQVAEGITEGVKHLHSFDLPHRFLHPNNVLFDSSMTVRRRLPQPWTVPSSVPSPVPSRALSLC